MKPTVGRIVHFHQTAGVTLAAVIAFVHSDTMVNLAVFDGNGRSFGQPSVQLVAPGQPKPEFGFYCEWMPDQVETIGTLVQAEACMTFPLSKATADALERIIDVIDRKIVDECQ